MSGQRVSVAWSTRREGNDGFVLEEGTAADGSNAWRLQFGPMPPHIVPSFVEGRRKIIAMMASRNGAKRVVSTEFDTLDLNDVFPTRQ